MSLIYKKPTHTTSWKRSAYLHSAIIHMNGDINNVVGDTIIIFHHFSLAWEFRTHQERAAGGGGAARRGVSLVHSQANFTGW